METSSVRTNIALNWESGTLTFKVTGDKAHLPEVRTWNVECIGFADTAVTMDGKAIPTTYDEKRNALCFILSTEAACEEACVSFASTALVQDNWLARVDERLMQIQSSPDEKEIIWKLLKARGRTATAVGTMRTLCETAGLADCLEEVIYAQE